MSKSSKVGPYQIVYWYCSSGGMPTPVPEYKFHPTRKWLFDFAWPEQKVALEIEGGAWTGGRHTRGKGYESDCAKYSEAAVLGWKVLRVTTGMLERGACWPWLDKTIGKEST